MDRRPKDTALPTLAVVLAATLVATGFALLTTAHTGGVWMLPLDDSYIFLRYAENLGDGTLLRFNPGDPPTGGVSSVPYPFVLAPAAALGLRGDALAVFAFVLGAALWTFAAARLRRALTPSLGAGAATAAALSVVLAGPLAATALSGMEASLVMAVAVVALDRLAAEVAHGRLRWAPWWLALLASLRPETGTLVVLGVAVVAVAPVSGGRRVHGRPLLAIAIAGAVLPAILLWAATGHPGPSTAVPKSPLWTPWPSPVFLLQHASGWLRVVGSFLLMGGAEPSALGPLNALDPAAAAPPAALLLWAAGALPLVAAELAGRRVGLHTLLTAWFVAGTLVLAVVDGGSAHGYRHLQPFLLGFYPYLVPGAIRCIRALLTAGAGAPRAAPIAAGLAAAAVLALQLPTLVGGALTSAQAASGLLQYRDAALWIRDHVPTGDAVAALDVGVLGVYGRRPVFDLYGLVTPETRGAATYYADVMGTVWLRVAALPPERRPRWAVLHRERFEERGDTGHLDPLRQRPVYTAAEPLGAARTIGRDLTVYAVRWPAPPAEPCSEAVSRRIAAGGWRIADRLATADTADARRHRLRLVPEAPAMFPSNRLLALDCGGRTAPDAVLGVAGRHRFEMQLDRRPARAALVMRGPSLSRPPEVEVNGVPAGRPAPAGGRPGGWTESWLDLPDEALAAGANRFEVRGRFPVARYWLVIRSDDDAPPVTDPVAPPSRR